MVVQQCEARERGQGQLSEQWRQSGCNNKADCVGGDVWFGKVVVLMRRDSNIGNKVIKRKVKEIRTSCAKEEERRTCSLLYKLSCRRKRSSWMVARMMMMRLQKCELS